MAKLQLLYYCAETLFEGTLTSSTSVQNQQKRPKEELSAASEECEAEPA